MSKEGRRSSGIAHTAADRARHRAVRERFRDEPGLNELVASGEIDVATYDPARQLQQAGPPVVDPQTLVEIGGALRQERERAGLSLAEMTARSGIDARAPSRLENGQNPNRLWRRCLAMPRRWASEFTGASEADLLELGPAFRSGYLAFQDPAQLLCGFAGSWLRGVRSC